MSLVPLFDQGLILKLFLLFSSLKERRPRGRRWHLPLLWLRSLRSRRLWTPCSRKGRKTLALVGNASKHQVSVYPVMETLRWCRWCQRIFAILAAMQTIFHQDLWCTLMFLTDQVCVWSVLISPQVVLFVSLHQVRTSSPNGIWPGLWNGHGMSACSVSGLYCTSVWRSLLRSTSSTKLWTARLVGHLTLSWANGPAWRWI